MERYLGLDVHAASCTLAVISERGRKLKDFPVETNGRFCGLLLRSGHVETLLGVLDPVKCLLDYATPMSDFL